MTIWTTPDCHDTDEGEEPMPEGMCFCRGRIHPAGEGLEWHKLPEALPEREPRGKRRQWNED